MPLQGKRLDYSRGSFDYFSNKRSYSGRCEWKASDFENRLWLKAIVGSNPTSAAMNEQEKIQKFISYSNTNEEHARRVLSLFDWDCDVAMDWYWRNVILLCDIED